MTQSLGEDAVQSALDSLEALATAEYGAAIQELFAADEPVEGNGMDALNSADAFWRVGRLIGISIKAPFAFPGDLGTRKTQTGALRAWYLADAQLAHEHPDWWEYNLVVAFLDHSDSEGRLDWLPPKHLPEVERVAWFLNDTHSERGLFRAFVMGIRPRLCRDRATTQAPASKGLVSAEPVQLITVGSIQTVAAQVIEQVPWLDDPRMLPVTTGIALLVLRYGWDGFCRRTLPAPETFVVET